MKFIFIFLIIPICLCKSQHNKEYYHILKTDHLQFHNNEIRVYRKHEISTRLELFRFYQDEKDCWKAEFYETRVSKNTLDETKFKTRKSKLNSLKNLELLWAKILDTDVNNLPGMKQFQYKLKKINRDYRIEDGEVVSSQTVSTILDGFTYFVKTNKNEFEYENPESYLEKYPNVDELLSFQQLLTLIRTEFGIFTKD